MKEMRTKSVKVRFSEEELLQAKANCPRAEFARWLRELSLNQKCEISNNDTPNSDVSLQFLKQISGIGNNLNQIAKRVNDRYSPIDSLDLLQQLTMIERQLQGLIKDAG